MSKKGSFLSLPETIAHAVNVSGVETVPHFAGLNSYEICNEIKKLCTATNIFSLENEGSAISAAIGSTAGGKRTLVPVSGLLTTKDVLTAAFLRMPFVCTSSSRFIETFTKEPGINPIEDSGWVVFYAESNQDVLDSVVQLYKICEDKKVMLPGVVKLDDTTLGQSVQVPTQQAVSKFLTKFSLHHRLDIRNPSYIGHPDADIEECFEQQKIAMKNSFDVISKVGATWSKRFRRDGEFFESYKTEDAEYVIVSSKGFTAKRVVDKLREEGEKVGLIRIRVMKPFPHSTIKKALEYVKKVGVVETNISGGKLYPEIKQTHGFCTKFTTIHELAEKDYESIFKHTKRMEKEENLWIK